MVGMIRVAADVRPLLPRFFSNRLRDVGAIRAAAETHDFALVCTLAHNMRGTAGSYGFPEIGALGTRLEDAAKRGAKSEIGALARELESLVDTLTQRAIGT
jgi:HPt (histidine-containing phosphotransfer) domain-containing protein